MGKLDKDQDGGKGLQLTRRQFLKAGAATAAVGAAGFEFAAAPSSANAAEVSRIYHTTCPYCSASCGQLVAVDANENILDVYGDHESPWNAGGLCAKGAGTYQLVANPRRLGYGNQNPNPTFNYDPAFDASAVAYKRIGNAAWTKMPLQNAMDEAAVALTTARAHDAAGWSTNQNSKSVAFFGSSHMNNDQNYLYRKLIANFGTSNIEHQARI